MECMVVADFDNDNADEIAADFGLIGLWLWNNGSWAQLSGLNPE